MGILDVFAAEDRVDVRFSTFYELVKGCAEREFITNGLKRKIPHAHILAMSKIYYNSGYQLNYGAPMGQWTLAEGLELWKKKHSQIGAKEDE